MSRFLIWLTTAFLFVPGGAVAESVLTGDLPRQANLEFRTRAVDGGLEVLDLADRSPAASAGVQDGDVIVAVNGRTFAKPYVGEDLLRRLDGGDRARLSIRRGSSQVEVEFRPQAEPLENLEGVTSTYAVLDVPDGSRLRTIVTRPDGAVGAASRGCQPRRVAVASPRHPSPPPGGSGPTLRARVASLVRARRNRPARGHVFKLASK